MIRHSFHKVRLSLSIDGTLDHQSDIKALTVLEIGNWQEDLLLSDEAAKVREAEDNEIELIDV